MFALLYFGFPTCSQEISHLGIQSGVAFTSLYPLSSLVIERSAQEDPCETDDSTFR